MVLNTAEKKKYLVSEGGYAAAVELLQRRGGCLFPAKRRDGSSTVVIGNEIHTFWERDSLNRAKVVQVARQFGFDEEIATGGRIAKWILRDICGVHTTKSGYDKRFLALAREGFHWHYTYVQPGHYPYLLEFDIAAAYMTFLLSQPSLSFDLHNGYLDDGGALECLREIIPTMPKWLRLIIIGILASHRMQFFTMGTGSNGYPELKHHWANKVEYGTHFNAAHKAVFGIYRIMQRLHSIGGEHIKRMHTDSFALTGDCPGDIEQRLFDCVDSHGLSTSCKAQGSAVIFNLNEGIIGRKWVGSPVAVRDELARLESKPTRYKLGRKARERWGKRGVVFDSSDYIKSLPTAYVQGEIIDVDLYRKRDDTFRSTG